MGSFVRYQLGTVLILFQLGAGSAAAFSVTPIAHLSAVGGQYFTGSTHSNGVNIDSSLVPVLGFSPSIYLIPIYLGSYHQTQSVYNFLGQNTLIQEQMDQTGVLRSAWAMNANWRLKPRIGYTKEWIKQSTDESLQNGLFNYTRAVSGISAERVFGNGSLEIGYDRGMVRYPNYQSLLSDPRFTSTGITPLVGTNVLNFDSDESSLTYQISSSDKRWNLSNVFTWVRENFVDQNIITTTVTSFPAESSDNKLRTDDIFNLILQQGLRPSSRWSFNLGETIQYYTSNQNSFDTAPVNVATPFTYRYYNFIETQLNPSITLFLDEARWDLTLAFNYGYRQYSHRRMQDGTGANQDSLIHSMNRGTTLTFRYAIGRNSPHKWLKGLYATLTGNVLTYWSNTRFEGNYPYNYTVYTYLGGLSWDY